MSLRHSIQFQYKIGNAILSKAIQENDLGVIMQSDLNCSLNCTRAAATAFNRLGLLKRVFKSFHPFLFHHLISAFIRPYTEYAIQVWNPWLLKDQKALERPQRAATKLVSGIKHLPYSERLRTLGLFSAQYQRTRRDLILVYQT